MRLPCSSTSMVTFGATSLVSTMGVPSGAKRLDLIGRNPGAGLPASRGCADTPAGRSSRRSWRLHLDALTAGRASFAPGLRSGNGSRGARQVDVRLRQRAQPCEAVLHIDHQSPRGQGDTRGSKESPKSRSQHSWPHHRRGQCLFVAVRAHRSPAVQFAAVRSRSRREDISERAQTSRTPVTKCSTCG